MALTKDQVIGVDFADRQSMPWARIMPIAGFGAAGPAMAAGAMLLLYQFTMAIFVGLGLLFILCLIFDQTKSLFQRWLLYGIGTLFSIAVLYVVTSTVLKLTINAAAALWSADIVNNILDTGSEGFSSQAMQQGGIGLLMTVLIISSPPLAAMFFQGTVGNFMHFSAFGGGMASRPGPQGQPPGSYGGGHGSGGSAPSTYTGQPNTGGQGVNAFGSTPGTPVRVNGAPSVVQADAIKPATPR